MCPHTAMRHLRCPSLHAHLLPACPSCQVRLLVEAGRARLDVTTRHGFTPLDEAHAAAATAVVEFLETLVRTLWGKERQQQGRVMFCYFLMAQRARECAGDQACPVIGAHIHSPAVKVWHGEHVIEHASSTQYTRTRRVRTALAC
jgi:hypothetical protein